MRSDNHRKKIFIHALRGLPGTELAYDYQYERTGKNDAKLEKFYFASVARKLSGEHHETREETEAPIARHSPVAERASVAVLASGVPGGYGLVVKTTLTEYQHAFSSRRARPYDRARSLGRGTRRRPDAIDTARPGQPRPIRRGVYGLLSVRNGWVKTHPVPPAFSVWGSFAELGENNQSNLLTILRKAAANGNAQASADIRKLGVYYSSCMDSVGAERAGAQPLKAELDRINAVQNRAQLEQEITRLHSRGVPLPTSPPSRISRTARR